MKKLLQAIFSTNFSFLEDEQLVGQLGWIWSRQYFPLIYTLRNLVTLLQRRFKIKRKSQYSRVTVKIPLSEELSESIYDFLHFFKQQVRNLKNTEDDVHTLVIFTDVGPTGGSVKFFRKFKGQKTLIQQIRCKSLHVLLLFHRTGTLHKRNKECNFLL